MPLTGDVDFRTESDITIAFALDDGSKGESLHMFLL
jgi:hypothetical protein